MVIPCETGGLLRGLILCVCMVLCFTDSSHPPCNATIKGKDLNTILQWECVPLSLNTTFTVYALVQGAQWEKVSGCTRVTSRLCDLSRVFTDLYLYSFVRLEMQETAGHPAWKMDMMVDLLSHMVFSAPSLNVSLNGSLLWVEVWFPSSLNRDLCPDKIACPVSAVFMTLDTTVTVYDKDEPSRSQTCSRKAKGEKVSCLFGLSRLGHLYCVVANFTSSDMSSLHCVHLSFPPNGSVFQWLGLCTLFSSLAAFLCILIWFRGSTAPPVPRTLKSLQDDEYRKLSVLHEDHAEDHLSIVSLSASRSSLDLDEAAEGLAEQPSLGDGYYSNPLPLLSEVDDEMECDGTGGEAECGFDVDSLASRKGMVPLSLGRSGDSTGRASPNDVPLCSVRLGPSEAEDFDNLTGFSGLPGSHETLQSTTAMSQHGDESYQV